MNHREKPNQNAVALLLADGLVKNGALPQAKTVLRQAMARNPGPRMNLPLQSRLIEVLHPDADRAAVPRECGFMRRAA